MDENALSNAVKEILNAIMNMPGVSGYSLEGKTLTIFVEDEETKKTLALPSEIRDIKVEIVISGRFIAL